MLGSIDDLWFEIDGDNVCGTTLDSFGEMDGCMSDILTFPSGLNGEDVNQGGEQILEPLSRLRDRDNWNSDWNEPVLKSGLCQEEFCASFETLELPSFHNSRYVSSNEIVSAPPRDSRDDCRKNYGLDHDDLYVYREPTFQQNYQCDLSTQKKKDIASEEKIDFLEEMSFFDGIESNCDQKNEIIAPPPNSFCSRYISRSTTRKMSSSSSSSSEEEIITEEVKVKPRASARNSFIPLLRISSEENEEYKKILKGERCSSPRIGTKVLEISKGQVTSHGNLRRRKAVLFGDLSDPGSIGSNQKWEEKKKKKYYTFWEISKGQKKRSTWPIKIKEQNEALFGDNVRIGEYFSIFTSDDMITKMNPNTGQEEEVMKVNDLAVITSTTIYRETTTTTTTHNNNKKKKKKSVDISEVMFLAHGKYNDESKDRKVKRRPYLLKRKINKKKKKKKRKKKRKRDMNDEYFDDFDHLHPRKRVKT